MSDAALLPISAFLIAPPEDAPQVAGWHTTLAGVGIDCLDTWASAAVVTDASTIDAAAVWDWTQDAAALEADWVAAIAEIQSAHIVVIVTTKGTTSTVQAQVAQYAVDAQIPLVYCGPTNDFLAVEPIVSVATTLAACKAWGQTMVGSTAIQAALASPNASLYSVRVAITQYIQPPLSIDAAAPVDAGVVLGARAVHVTPAPPAAPSSAAPVAAGVLGAALVVGFAARALRRKGKAP